MIDQVQCQRSVVPPWSHTRICATKVIVNCELLQQHLRASPSLLHWCPKAIYLPRASRLGLSKKHINTFWYLSVLSMQSCKFMSIWLYFTPDNSTPPWSGLPDVQYLLLQPYCLWRVKSNRNLLGSQDHSPSCPARGPLGNALQTVCPHVWHIWKLFWRWVGGATQHLSLGCKVMV